MKSRDWMSTFMVVYVILMLLGLQSGNIVESLGETGSLLVVIFLALLVILLPLSRGDKKWTLWASTGLGALAVIASVVGATQNPITIPVAISAAVGLLIAIFGVKALRASS